ncbi:MAG: hypothetical protein M3065_18435, partial [Actinomycetota bacterium]|nr:hypothetical protein [Actinomycetota bacterium]
VSVQRRHLGGGLSWVSPSRLLVGAPGPVLPNAGAAMMFGLSGGRLAALRVPQLGPLNTSYVWSPDGRTVAFQSLRGAGNRVFVERSDGSDRRPVARAVLSGWSPDGRLVLFTGGYGEFNAGSYVTLDLRSRRTRTVLSSSQVAVYAHTSQVELGGLVWSGDGRYLAARATIPGGKSVIVIARADGLIIRLITSSDVISMLAWSPLGHELAYTTSGFPSPHELYVLSNPRVSPRRILSQAEHFDWVTWSPDDRWLLIDNEHQNAWELLYLTGQGQARLLAGASVPTRRLARLGGEPLWCCPQDHYAGG